MRQLIVDLKAEHPGFRPHEIATICFLRFERRPSDHTVKRVLADGPKPTVTGRRYPPYAQIADPYQRRRAIVDLHAEGWSIMTISAYLQTPRTRVYEVLKRWATEGHAGLDDKPSTPREPARKATMSAISEVRRWWWKVLNWARTACAPLWSKSVSISHRPPVGDFWPSIANSTDCLNLKVIPRVSVRRCRLSQHFGMSIGVWMSGTSKSITWGFQNLST
jgi:hypothetical protein